MILRQFHLPPILSMYFAKISHSVDLCIPKGRSAVVSPTKIKSAGLVSSVVPKSH
jgi:hypothetical protein